jgi:hypothetical protein
LSMCVHGLVADAWQVVVDVTWAGCGFATWVGCGTPSSRSSVTLVALACMCGKLCCFHKCTYARQMHVAECKPQHAGKTKY